MAEGGVDILRATKVQPRGRSPSPAGRTNHTTHSRDTSAKSSQDTMDREGVLSALGYKAEKVWKASAPLLDKSELCLRCGKKVYPVERVDVDGLYHKGCFKCKTCGIQLTLKTFQRDVDVKQPKKTREVYCKRHIPRAAGGNVDADALEIRRALDAQKHVSPQVRHTVYESHYDPDALEFQHVKELKRRKKVRRRSTLRSSKDEDFEKFGVYDAQKALEAVHHQEEDELYRQMFDDRKRHVEKLGRHLKEEKNRTVADLIHWFEQRGASKEEKEAGLKKIENFYRSQKEERMRLLLQRLTMEEQSAVARMIEKHSHEMLILIQEKEREAEKAMKFEFRESQLMEDGGVLVPPEEEDSSEESEEEDEDEEEDTQEMSESFSEASYRVQMYEDSVKKATQKPIPEKRRQLINRRHHRSAEELDRPRSYAGRGTSSSEQSEAFQRHGSLRAPKSPSHIYPGHDSIPTINSSGPPGYHLPAGKLPVDYFPFELDEDGEVLVRVHAAKDAHLISEHLKSSHFCQSPHAHNQPQPFMYDLTARGVSAGIGAKAPKPLRPRSGRAKPGANESGSSPTTGRKHGGKDADGKFILFQKPGDLQHSYSNDEDTKGRSTNRKNKENTGKKSKKNKNNRNRESMEEIDIDNLNLKTKGHANRARKALRAMNADLNSSGEGPGGPDDVFIKTQPQAPKVAPPPTKKSNLYSSPDVFKEFDDNAVREAKKEHRTFTELVRQLSRRCENELQKVRAIFRWITAKDLNKMQFADTLDPESPVGLLRGIKLGVETYHNLFKRLCSYAGLHCEIIEGYSKGAGYKPGAGLKGHTFKNQWTAVCIEGAWRFVNCNWGARHVKGPRDDNLTYKCDEFYFVTDPEEHIYQHFPDDTKWQLLPSPISKEEFIKLPVLKSPFFNKQLAFSRDYDSTIHSSDGYVEVRILFMRSTSFTAQLKSKDGNVKPEVLQDRVLVRVVNDEAIFITNLPSTGSYFLEIYISDSIDKDSMVNACSFTICCYSISSNAHVSYPPIACFGRTPYFKKVQIQEETHTDPYITHSGELLIALLCHKDIKLSHALRFWNHRDRKLEDLERYAFLMHRSEHLISYIIHCPKRGGYVFSLHGSPDPEASSAKMRCVYRYYINCRAPFENARPLPKATKRWHGCRVIEPMLGDLPCKSKTRFQLESSVALELVVTVNESWFHLQKSGNLWQGTVNTGDGKGRLYVYGRFDNTKEKYIPILEYNIRGPRGMEEEVKALMKYL